MEKSKLIKARPIMAGDKTSRVDFITSISMVNKTSRLIILTKLDNQGGKHTTEYHPDSCYNLTYQTTDYLKNIIVTCLSKSGKSQLLEETVTIQEEEIILSPIFIEEIQAWISIPEHVHVIDNLEEVRVNSFNNQVKKQVSSFKNTIHIFYQLENRYYQSEGNKYLLGCIGGLEFISEAILGTENSISIVVPCSDITGKETLSITKDLTTEEVNLLLKGDVICVNIDGISNPLVIGFTRYKNEIHQQNNTIMRDRLLEDYKREIKQLVDNHASEIKALKENNEQEKIQLNKRIKEVETENASLLSQLQIMIDNKKLELENKKIEHTTDMMEEKYKHAEAATKREEMKMLPATIAAVASVLTSIIVIWKLLK